MKVKTNIKERVRAKRHKELIQIVKDNYGLFNKSRLALGNALIELHDGNYWKDTHTTFRDYCEENFSISDNYARRLMDGAKTQSDLPKSSQPLITTESQARALGNVPESKRVDVLKEAAKNGHVTAKSIEEAAAEIEKKDKTKNVPIGTDRVSVKSDTKPPSKDKKVLYDEIGIPIPDDAIPYWERRQEVQNVLTQISRLKSIVVGGREAQDHQWLKVTNSIADTFDSLRSLISEAKPYSVCTTCQGTPTLNGGDCNFCRSTGLISKWQWDTQSRQEIKDIVLRRAADLKKEREANVH